MGALIFYIGIYFIGYYAANLLNRMAGHILIRSRRIAGFVLVLTVSLGHGYKIISTPPPHDHDDGAGCAGLIRHHAGHDHRNRCFISHVAGRK